MSVKVSPRLRQQVFDRARGQCEYCRSQALYTTETFEIEHIQPLALGGATLLNNLALACSGCNGRKSDKIVANDPDNGNDIALFHPRTDQWTDHFCWTEEDETIKGLTSTGRASVFLLQMNRIALRNWRRVMRRSNLHPPKDSSQ